MVLAALVVLATTAMAAPGDGNVNPGIAPPNSSPLDTSYARWGAAWWQWIFSMPLTNHPFFSSGAVDCSCRQPGSQVWFLAGNFAGGAVTRQCNVPVGTRLFFPVFNAWADNTGNPPTTYTKQELVDLTAGMVNPAVVHASIDGVPVKNLSVTVVLWAQSETDLLCPAYLPMGIEKF
jgi:hypothetical protein